MAKHFWSLIEEPTTLCHCEDSLSVPRYGIVIGYLPLSLRRHVPVAIWHLSPLSLRAKRGNLAMGDYHRASFFTPPCPTRFSRRPPDGVLLRMTLVGRFSRHPAPLHSYRTPQNDSEDLSLRRHAVPVAIWHLSPLSLRAKRGNLAMGEWGTQKQEGPGFRMNKVKQKVIIKD